MAYNLNTFLKPISDDDKNILIYNDNGELVYTINPFSVTNIQVRGNVITISIKSGRTILLDFLNNNFAKDALPILQNRIFTLTEKTPNFIDKQVSNWISNQGLGPQGPIGPTGGYIIEPSPTFYGTVSVIGTISMSGNIIPDLDYTWDLGSSTNRWNNIYVKDALVASQSIYLGGMKLSSDGTHIVVEDRAVNKYESFSYTDLTIGVVGEYLSLTTEKNLSYVNGDSIKVANRLQNFFDQGDYTEDSVYKFFIAFVDFYNRDSGELNVIITYTNDTGFTASTWYLKYNSDIIGFEANLDERFRGFGIVGTSSTTFNIPEIGHTREIITQQYLGFYAGQEVIVYNQLPNNYEVEDYSEDDGNYFIGKVDYYYPETGDLFVIAEYAYGSGTYSDWQITLSSLPQSNVQLGTTASFEELTVTGNTNVQQVNGTTASFEDLTVTGPSNIQQVLEVLTTATATGLSPSTYELNFNDGSIFYLEPEGDNFVASYLNVPTTDDRIISTTIIISQTASAYIPNVVSINGDIIPISWANGSLPSGNANQTDIVGFSFMRIGATWSKVFGQLSTFTTI